jgi:hypothetical protein
MFSECDSMLKFPAVAYLKLLSGSLAGTDTNQDRPVRFAGAMAETRTGYLPNAGQTHYCWANLFGSMHLYRHIILTPSSKSAPFTKQQFIDFQSLHGPLKTCSMSTKNTHGPSFHGAVDPPGRNKVELLMMKGWQPISSSVNGTSIGCFQKVTNFKRLLHEMERQISPTTFHAIRTKCKKWTHNGEVVHIYLHVSLPKM